MCVDMPVPFTTSRTQFSPSTVGPGYQTQVIYVLSHLVSSGDVLICTYCALNFVLAGDQKMRMYCIIR